MRALRKAAFDLVSLPRTKLLDVTSAGGDRACSWAACNSTPWSIARPTRTGGPGRGRRPGCLRSQRARGTGRSRGSVHAKRRPNLPSHQHRPCFRRRPGAAATAAGGGPGCAGQRLWRVQVDGGDARPPGIRRCGHPAHRLPVRGGRRGRQGEATSSRPMIRARAGDEGSLPRRRRPDDVADCVGGCRPYCRAYGCLNGRVRVRQSTMWSMRGAATWFEFACEIVGRAGSRGGGGHSLHHRRVSRHARHGDRTTACSTTPRSRRRSAPCPAWQDALEQYLDSKGHLDR